VEYQGNEVLAAIDDHRIAVLLLCGTAMLLTYTWFLEAIRVGRRDKTYCMPLACTFFWFAHDTTFVLRYDKWFNEYDHWYVKMFWVMLVLTVAIEVVYLSQAVRYSRLEIAPWMSPRAYTAAFFACLAGVYVVWLVIKASIDDDLYIIAFGLTVVVYPVMATPLLLRRRSAHGASRSMLGQSRLLWTTSLGLPVGWFLATALYFGDAFRSPEWIALGIVSTVWSLALTIYVWRLTDPNGSDPDPALDSQPELASAHRS
jgi:hypothetical protein